MASNVPPLIEEEDDGAPACVKRPAPAPGRRCMEGARPITAERMIEAAVGQAEEVARGSNALVVVDGPG